MGVVGQANNQAPTPKPTQDHKRVWMVFKGTSTKSATNFCLTKGSIKEAYDWRYEWNMRFLKGRMSEWKIGVTKFKYFAKLVRRGMC